MLDEYVHSQFPEINYKLRRGKDCPEVDVFDTLFKQQPLPPRLYRQLELHNVQVSKGDIIIDKAYLSTSYCFDCYYRDCGKNVACIIIHIEDSSVKSINVEQMCPLSNKEGEYILPRNLKLKIRLPYKIFTQKEFEEFLEYVHSDQITSWAMQQDGINSYTVYDVDIVDE